MAEEKIVDFLQAVIAAEPEFQAPNVTAVRMQVRTGASVPAKKDMMKRGYVVLIWSYQVKDAKAFQKFLEQNEDNLTKLFDEFDTIDPATGETRNRLDYHGTYPVRARAQAAGAAMKSMFGGERDIIDKIETFRTEGPDDMEPGTEQEIASTIKSLLSHAKGKVTSEILDPTVKF